MEGEEAQLAFWQSLRRRPGVTVRAARAAKGRGGEKAVQVAASSGSEQLRSTANRLLRRLEMEDASGALRDDGLRTVLQALYARLGTLLKR
jgi:hypothetical protein